MKYGSVSVAALAAVALVAVASGARAGVEIVTQTINTPIVSLNSYNAPTVGTYAGQFDLYSILAGAGERAVGGTITLSATTPFNLTNVGGTGDSPCCFGAYTVQTLLNGSQQGQPGFVPIYQSTTYYGNDVNTTLYGEDMSSVTLTVGGLQATGSAPYTQTTSTPSYRVGNNTVFDTDQHDTTVIENYTSTTEIGYYGDFSMTVALSQAALDSLNQTGVLDFSATGSTGPTLGDEIELTGASITVDDVPEPATWAVMLVGLGGLGAVLRRARLRHAKALVPA